MSQSACASIPTFATLAVYFIRKVLSDKLRSCLDCIHSDLNICMRNTIVCDKILNAIPFCLTQLVRTGIYLNSLLPNIRLFHKQLINRHLTALPINMPLITEMQIQTLSPGLSFEINKLSCNVKRRNFGYMPSRALSEDSDQTAHLRGLINIFTGCILDSQGCKGCNEDSGRTAQADLSLRWAHASEDTFSQVGAQ